MPNSPYVGMLQVLNTAGAAIANSAVETALVPSYQFPANSLTTGMRFRIKAEGKYSNTGTPNLSFGLRMGTNGSSGTVGSDTQICSTAANATVTTVTNQLWLAELDLTVLTVGASGTIMGTGRALVFSTATASGNWAIAGSAGTAPVVATINTTQANYLTLTGLWGTANASNTIQALGFSLESLN